MESEDQPREPGEGAEPTGEPGPKTPSLDPPSPPLEDAPDPPLNPDPEHGGAH